MESNAETFCQACLNGDIAAVTSMLTKDRQLANAKGMVRPDHREFMKKNNSEGGWTALHLAAHYAQPEVVRILIEAGANLNELSSNHEGNTPMMAAVAGGNLTVVQLLMDKGADPKKLDKAGRFNALKLAELQKKTEIYKALERAPAVLNFKKID